MLFKIPFPSWSLKAAIEIEIPDSTEESFRLKLALELAVKTGVDLKYAYLKDAYLKGADLKNAYLPDAYMKDVDLTDADLTDAYLKGADLTGAYMKDADLKYADLTGVDLKYADLTGADLTGAYLKGADLTDADLKGAKNLDGSQLRGIRTDVFDVLLRGIPEVGGLLKALREGRINGSAYEGDCACLVGTIANIRGVDIENEQFDFRDSSRPAERWFMGIKEGDTPETNQIAKITESWILEFQSLISAAE